MAPTSPITTTGCGTLIQVSIDADTGIPGAARANTRPNSRNAGDVINATTKSGTSQKSHFGGFDFFTNDKLLTPGAFFALSRPSTKRHNQFGGWIGGAAAASKGSAKHSTFFFVDYEAKGGSCIGQSETNSIVPSPE